MPRRLILEERDWLVQPQQSVTLNPSNALARKLILNLPLNGRRYDLAGNRLVTFASGASFRPNRKGVSLRSASSAATGSLSLNLSAYSSLTFSFWLLWDAFANNDALLMEQGPPFFSTGGIMFDPNDGGGNWVVATNIAGTSTHAAGSFPRPSAGVFHHYVIGLNRAVAGGVAYVYLNGVPQTVTALNPNVLNGTYVNHTLHIFSRGGTSLFGSGNLQDFSIFRGVLSDEEARSLWVKPYQIYSPRVFPRYVSLTAPSYDLVGASSSQNSSSSVGAAAQQHALAGAGASQSAQATSLAVSQDHALQAAPSASVGTSSTGAIGQSVTLAGQDASQASQSSAASISQTAQLTGENATQSADASTGAIAIDLGLVASHSQQNSQSSTANITQAHTLVGATSSQTNASSVANISGDVALGASTSIQFASSGTAAITQNQTLFGVGSSQGSAAHSAAISQIHALFGSVSVQPNQSLVYALTQIHVLSAAASTQNAFSGQGFITMPGAGDFTDYIKNRLFVISQVDTKFVVKRGGTEFIIER